MISESIRFTSEYFYNHYGLSKRKNELPLGKQLFTFTQTPTLISFIFIYFLQHFYLLRLIIKKAVALTHFIYSTNIVLNQENILFFDVLLQKSLQKDNTLHSSP